ncbi:MAG: AMP-binding protein [Bdellovibrionales bacterium]
MEKIWLKNYHPSVTPTIPSLQQDLLDLFFETCEKFKNHSAYSSFDKEISYDDLKNLSLQLAGYLQSQNLKKGDRIALQLPNVLQYPVSLWASLLSGLTVVNLNPVYTKRETLKVLQDSGAKAIIMLSSCAHNLEQIYKETSLETIIITKPGDLLNSPKKQLLNFVFKYIKKKEKNYKINMSVSFLEALSFKSQKKFQIQKKNMDDVLFIQYTGGTTGVPKGACLTQKNILSNLKQCQLWFDPYLDHGKECVLAPLPLYHIFAFLVNGLLLFLYGAKSVLIADPRNISQLIPVIKKHPFTIGIGVNTLFKALILHPKFKTIDFSTWKFSVAGGMSLEENIQKNWKKITGVKIIEGYGLTEASPVVSSNFIDEPKNKSIGCPLPSTEIRIVNPKGEELSIDEDGELEVKGPQVMQEYYNNPEETQKVLTSDGWLKTGDIASIDKDGYIFIKDRKKDMIIVSGFNVYPNEIEDVLGHHPEIKDSTVVGVKDDYSLEAIKAFVVKNTPELQAEAIKKYCKEYLAPYKIPKHIEFVDEIPKTMVGKPLRRLLKDK